MQQFDETTGLEQAVPTTPASPGAARPPAELAGFFEPERSTGAARPAGWLAQLGQLTRFDVLDLRQLEDNTRRRGTLLLLMMSAVVLFLIMTLPLSAALGLLRAGDGWAVLAVVSAILTAFIFNQLRQVKVAAYIFLTGVGLGLLIRSWDNLQVELVVVSFNYFAFAACVVLAGLIIDETAPFIVAIVGIVCFVVVFLNYINLNPDQTRLILQVAFYGAGLHFILALMAWANARAIDRAIQHLAHQNTRLSDANQRLGHNLEVNNLVGGTINQLATDLSQISYDQLNRVQSQAQAVAVITSTLEELSTTARQVAEVAEGVFTATEQALQTAESGGQSVGSSIDSIATLTGQVESITMIANELGQQSRRISEIVETISELAEETSLLALNATIEASGAGEYGRRFAVVAQEVQLLATKSRGASRDVQAILGQIRASINNTILATGEGLSEARRMSEVAGLAGESIEQIIETVESTTFLARQIHLTTQQQRTATDQAVELVRRVAGDSREAAARAQQLMAASTRLSQTAISLRQEQPSS